MDNDTADILVRLDNITKEEEDLENSLVSCKLCRSDCLRQLQDKIGKKFTRKGVTYTICQRGDTYFTKSFGGGNIPSLD